MKEAVAPLSELQSFRDALLFLSKNPILGILAGFAITGIVQSSSASMGRSSCSFIRITEF